MKNKQSLLFPTENSQQGIVHIMAGLAVLVLLAGVVALVYVTQHNTYPEPKAADHSTWQNYNPRNGAPQPSATPINSLNDLSKVQKDLETTNIDSLGNTITENDKDAAGF